MDIFENEIGNLNNEQKKAVLHDLGKAVCIAGPGSGKTRVIVLRAMRLLCENEKKAKREGSGVCLTLAYNKSAAEEMKTRSLELAVKMFGENAENEMKQMHFTTIHSYCYSIIRRYCTKTGAALPTVIDDVERANIVAKLYSDLTGNTLVNSDVIKKIMSDMQSELDKTDDVNDPLSLKIGNSYKAYKEKCNIIDFGDMLELADKMLIADDDFCREIKHAFLFVQVDEAQDLSELQSRIISNISCGNVLYVADDDQSIYGFRGAMPEVLKKIISEDKKTKLYKLQTNYRSENEIVDVATAFIEQNRIRFRKKLKTKAVGGTVKIEAFSTLEAEALSIARRTLEEVAAGRTVGILYRNNASNILPLVMLFIQATMHDNKLAPVILGQKTNLAELDFIKRISQTDCDPKDYDILLFSSETRGKRQLYSEILRDVGRILKRHTRSYDDIIKLAQRIDDFSAIQSKKGELSAKVTFSTIHSAKGLEFDTVFVIDCVRGEFPHCDLNDKTELSEERRLMYVAMTRARSKLYVTYPQKAGLKRLTAGQFIEELMEL